MHHSTWSVGAKSKLEAKKVNFNQQPEVGVRHHHHHHHHCHHHHHGLPAYSHHDKIPPWWEYVSNDKVGMCQCQNPTIHDKVQLGPVGSGKLFKSVPVLRRNISAHFVNLAEPSYTYWKQFTAHRVVSYFHLHIVLGY